MASILVTGLTTLDLIFKVDTLPNKGEKYQASDGILSGGGNAGNAAVAIARLGGEVSIFSAVGQDDVASLIMDGLQKENVDIEPMQQLEQLHSSFSSIQVDRFGARQILNFRKIPYLDNFNSILELPIKDGYLTDSRWDEAAIQTLELANRLSKPGVLDAEAPVSREAFAAASHVAFSRQGLRDFTKNNDLLSGLKSLGQNWNKWICVTDGSAGVYFFDQGNLRHVKAPRVKVVDTLGAGDVWHGAFILGLAEGRNELQAIEFANSAAALKCKAFGGRAGIPTRAEVVEFDSLIMRGSKE